MDIYQPIREILLLMAESEPTNNNLDKQCGIISSCYPPNELYPDGYTIKYPFTIKPKDAERYVSYER